MQPSSPTDPPREPTGPHDHHFATDHLLEDLKGRSVRGAAVTFTAQAIKFTLQLASVAVLARLLDPADFGLVAMVTAVTGFVAIFKDAGLSMATVQRERITHEQVSTLFWINVALSLLLALLTAALAPAIAWFYGDPRLTLITLAVAGTFLFSGLTVQHQALLQRQMRFKAMAIVEVLSLAAGVSAGIAAALLDAGYWSLVIAAATQAVVNAILVWPVTGWRPARPRRGTGVLPMLKFGGNLMGFTFTDYWVTNLDKAIIGWRWGASPLGYYSRAFALVVMPISQVAGPVGMVMVPALCRLREKPDVFRAAYGQALALLTWGFLPVVAMMLVNAPEWVRLILGPQWDPVVPLLRFLAIGAAAFSVNHSTGWLFISTDRTGPLLRWGLLNLLVFATLFGVTAPMGIRAMALAFGVALIPMSAIQAWVATRGTPVGWLTILGAIGRPVLVTAASGAAAWLVCDAMRPAWGPIAILVAGVAILLGGVGVGLCATRDRLLVRQVLASFDPSHERQRAAEASGS